MRAGEGKQCLPIFLRFAFAEFEKFLQQSLTFAGFCGQAQCSKAKKRNSLQGRMLNCQMEAKDIKRLLERRKSGRFGNRKFRRYAVYYPNPLCVQKRRDLFSRAARRAKNLEHKGKPKCVL